MLHNVLSPLRVVYSDYLIDVQQNVAAADDDAFDGQIFSYVLRLAHFVVHELPVNGERIVNRII